MTKIALITGGSRGLGEDMALRLAEKGHDIILTYQSQQALADAVVQRLRALGRQAVALHFDAADVSSLPAFIASVKDVLKNQWNRDRLDILINNAGIGATIPIEKATEADFDRFMNIHFKSVYFLSQQVLTFMHDGGRIINISTGTTRFVNPGYSIYASMKGGIEVFTRYLAREVGPRGITANVVAPGPVETDFNNAGIRNAPPERRAMLTNMTALGRFGTPEDIGTVVAFLCSDDARWITGQRLEVSGGINL